MPSKQYRDRRQALSRIDRYHAFAFGFGAMYTLMAYLWPEPWVEPYMPYALPLVFIVVATFVHFLFTAVFRSRAYIRGQA